MPTWHSREIHSRGGASMALGKGVLRRLTVLACAALLLLTVLAAGAAPSPSMAAETQLRCPLLANGLLSRLGAPRVPGDLDLCIAWLSGNTPAYPVFTRKRKRPSCDAWVSAVTDKNNPLPLAETFPQPYALERSIYTTIYQATRVGPVGSLQYRIQYNFLVKSSDRWIELRRPTWDNMTESQIAFLDSFYFLVLVHERGHTNILQNLLEKFRRDEVLAVHPFKLETPEHAAQRLLQTQYDQALAALVLDDRILETKDYGYDKLTGGGFKQSALGGTDLPRLDRLCLPITSTFDENDEGWTASGD